MVSLACIRDFQLRILVFSSLVSTLTLLGSVTAKAENSYHEDHPYSTSGAQMSLWHGLTNDEQFMVDRVAADFYEANLRLAQSRQIEAATASIYTKQDAQARAEFRNQRRNVWDKMKAEKRQTLRNVKLPTYANLTEAQKAPFRQIALEQLAPARANKAQTHALSQSASDI